MGERQSKTDGGLEKEATCPLGLMSSGGVSRGAILLDTPYFMSAEKIEKLWAFRRGGLMNEPLGGASALWSDLLTHDPCVTSDSAP